MVFHRLFGIPGKQAHGSKKLLTSSEAGRLSDAVLRLTEYVKAQKANQPVPSKYVTFVAACLRQTDNIKPRQRRFDVLYSESFG